MKNKIIALAITGMAFSACSDNKKQEQDLLNQVIKLHDEVMAKDEQAVKNKMQLDSLIKTNRVTNKDSATVVVNNLSNADKAMEDWMHQFTADNSGKPHDEVMRYLNDQKKKLIAVDSQVNQAVNQSNTYISTLKK